MYEPKYWNMDFDVPDWDEREYEIIRTHDQFDKVEQEWSESDGEIAVDTETDSLDHTDVTVAGIPFGFDWYKSYYLPLNHFKGENANHELIDRLFDLIYSSDKVYFYNARFDMRILETLDFDIDKMNYFDVSVLVYNMDTECQNKKLEDLKKHVLEWPVTDVDPTTIIYRRPEDTLDYTAGDSHATYILPQIFDGFYKKLKTPVDIDNKFIRPLKDMEEEPLEINIEWYREIKKQAEKEKKELQSKIYEAFGQEFNIDSNQQLREVLKEHDLDTGSETDGGKMSTGKDALKSIEDEHEGIKYLLENSSLQKDISNYINPFLNKSDIEYHESGMQGLFDNQTKKQTKLVNFHYNNTKTRTGRLSASKDQNNPYFAELNVQNITKSDKTYYKLEDGDEVFGYDLIECSEEEADFKGPETERSIRHGIRPNTNGFFWCSVDFSSQELVTLACVTGDENMLEELSKPDGDIHNRVKNEVIGKFGDYDRDTAKQVVYGTLYGATPWKLSKILDLDGEEEGEEVLEELWNTYPGMRKWIDKKVKQARSNGYIDNYFGRIRWLTKYLESDEDWMQDKVERICSNTPIQSVGGDVIKIATTNVYEDILKGGCEHVKWAPQVHDEINFQIREDIDVFKEYIPKIKDAMEFEIDGWELDLEVDFEIGPTWGKMAPLEVYDDGVTEFWLADKYMLR